MLINSLRLENRGSLYNLFFAIMILNSSKRPKLTIIFLPLYIKKKIIKNTADSVENMEDDVFSKDESCNQRNDQGDKSEATTSNQFKIFMWGMQSNM